MLKRVAGLATLSIAVMLHACGLEGARAETPASTPLKIASGQDLSGKSVNPFEQAGGKPVVLIFVRTDCPISNRYAPTIQLLSHKYEGKALFTLVYPDKSETPQKIETHLHEYGYDIAALRDPQHSLVKLGQVEITPETAVFNGKGELIYHGRIDNWYKEFGRARSAPTTHELDDAIQAVLNGSHPVPSSVGGVGCYISDLR